MNIKQNIQNKKCFQIYNIKSTKTVNFPLIFFLYTNENSLCRNDVYGRTHISRYRYISNFHALKLNIKPNIVLEVGIFNIYTICTYIV